MKTVSLSGRHGSGRVALVDDHDLLRVEPFTWWLLIRGEHYTPHVFTQTREDGRKITLYMHTLITGWSYVDHADGDGLNNQRYNLREANQGTQQRQPAQAAPPHEFPVQRSLLE
jgi:hypothetical protein